MMDHDLFDCMMDYDLCGWLMGYPVQESRRSDRPDLQSGGNKIGYGGVYNSI
jgi:hypothetical protein